MSDQEPLAQERVNINTASLDSLRDDVIGFGDVLAERIVAYRTERGPFATISELTAITGIGPKLLLRVTDQLTVTGLGETPDIAPVDEFAIATVAQPVSEEQFVSGTVAPELAEFQPVDDDVTRMGAESHVPAELATDDETEKPVTRGGEVLGESEQIADWDEQGISNANIENPETDDDMDILGELVQDLPDDEAGWLDDEDELVLAWPDEEEEDWDDEDLEDLTPEELAELDELIEQDVEIAAMGAVIEDEPDPVAGQDEDLWASEDRESDEDAVVDEPIMVATKKPEEDPMSAVHEAAPLSPIAAAAPAAPDLEDAPVRDEKRRSSSLLMVLLGGLLGVALTLLVGIILSGTIDFAPRRQVDALSRNMGTMQANSELAWERVDALSSRADEIDRHLTRLDAMADTVATLEQDIIAAQAELDSLDTSLSTLSSQVQELGQAVEATDTRVTGVEGQVGELAGTVTALEGSVEEVQGYVDRFDGFFSALRDLLLDMQGVPEAGAIVE